MSALRNTAVAAAMLVAAGMVPSGARATGESLVAILHGGNEIDPGGNAGAGDPNGYGIATIHFVSNKRLCFSIILKGIDTPTAAHIHVGKAGQNGGIVIPLSPVPSDGKRHASSGCRNATAADVKAVKNNPSGHYVNVHTGDFSAGALRGQLF